MYVPFNKISIRIRVFVADARHGKETLSGQTLIPLMDVKMKQKQQSGDEGSNIAFGGLPMPSQEVDDLPSPSQVRFRGDSLSEMWEEKNPVEEGELVTWCEFQTNTSASRRKLEAGSSFQEPSRDDCVVNFGETSTAESSMKLRVLFRGPERQLRRESKQQSSATNRANQNGGENFQRHGGLNRKSSILSTTSM